MPWLVFHYIHHWSQDEALAHTARQTAALTGFHWGGGLYVNYAFMSLWAGDAALWWRDRSSYEGRSAVSRDILLAIFVFMFVNGGIVFAHGPARASASLPSASPRGQGSGHAECCCRRDALR